MNRNILRSGGAIVFGWMTILGSFIAMTMAVNSLNRVTFHASAQLSLGWVLVILFMTFVSSVLGGFVTGAVAQRREIEHAVGLALFTLLVSICIPIVQKKGVSVPNGYAIVLYIVAIPSTLLGGWLRMKQRVLLAAGSEAIIRATKRARLPAAILAALATFVVVLYVTGALGTLGLMPILGRLLGEQHPATGMLPCFAAVLASGLSAWYVFKKIAGERTAPMNDSTASDGDEPCR
jgi:hypothetical protein